MDEPFITELFGRAIDEEGVLGDVLLEPALPESEEAADAPESEEAGTA